MAPKVHSTSSSTTPRSEASGMFERRQRRKNKLREKRPSATSNEDDDPYESDPGESYREHCERNRPGIACLSVPKFMRQKDLDSSTSVLTSPPSPSDMPSSLPPHWTRVRYSLRSSITDGAQPQPRLGTSLLERRELRPNGVKLNVSHWSEEGGRPYMEDRYVRVGARNYVS